MGASCCQIPDQRACHPLLVHLDSPSTQGRPSCMQDLGCVVTARAVGSGPGSSSDLTDPSRTWAYRKVPNCRAYDFDDADRFVLLPELDASVSLPSKVQANDVLPRNIKPTCRITLPDGRDLLITNRMRNHDMFCTQIFENLSKSLLEMSSSAARGDDVGTTTFRLEEPVVSLSLPRGFPMEEGALKHGRKLTPYISDAFVGTWVEGRMSICPGESEGVDRSFFHRGGGDDGVSATAFVPSEHRSRDNRIQKSILQVRIDIRGCRRLNFKDLVGRIHRQSLKYVVEQMVDCLHEAAALPVTWETLFVSVAGDEEREHLNVLKHTLLKPVLKSGAPFGCEEAKRAIGRGAKCLLVIGNSGVGKSSFCSLIDGSLRLDKDTQEWAGSFMMGNRDVSDQFDLGAGEGAEANRCKVAAVASAYFAKSGNAVVLVDTPGCHGASPEDDEAEEILDIRRHVEAIGAVHTLVLLCTPDVPVAEAVWRRCELLREMSGRSPWGNSCVVVNGWGHSRRAKSMREQGYAQAEAQFEANFKAAMREHYGEELSEDDVASIRFFYVDTHFFREEPDEAASMLRELQRLELLVEGTEPLPLEPDAPQSDELVAILTAVEQQGAKDLRDSLQAIQTMSSWPDDINDVKLKAVEHEVQRRMLHDFTYHASISLDADQRSAALVWLERSARIHPEEVLVNIKDFAEAVKLKDVEVARLRAYLDDCTDLGMHYFFWV